MENHRHRRHHRDGSLSSIGSWGSDIGAIVDNLSDGENSDCSCSSIVAGMAILASSSPEIKALNLSISHNSTSFTQQHSFHCTSFLHHGNDENSIESGVSTSSSCSCPIAPITSPTVEDNGGMNLSSSFLAATMNAGIADTEVTEEEKFQDNILSLSPTTNSSVMQGLCFEDICLVDLEANKENIPPGIDAAVLHAMYKNKNENNNTKNKRRPPPPFALKRRALSDRTNLRTNVTNITSSTYSKNYIQQQRPPKPLIKEAPAPSPSLKRPSFHRRISYDSLPSPSEINGAQCNVPATRPSLLRLSTTSSTSTSSLLPRPKPHHRRNTGLIVASRSMNLSTGFR